MNTSALLNRLLMVATLMLSVPLTAAAQPREGQVALGGDIGVFLPSDDQFDSALTFGGFVDVYPTARFAIRPSLSVASPAFERGTDEHARQTRLGVDLIYNWEGGRIHPFVGAGMGAYFLQFTNDGNDIGDADGKLGFAMLGGLEYFLNRAWTVKGEAQYHWVDERPGVDPDGLAMRIGLKRYF